MKQENIVPLVFFLAACGGIAQRGPSKDAAVERSADSRRDDAVSVLADSANDKGASFPDAHIVDQATDPAAVRDAPGDLPAERPADAAADRAADIVADSPLAFADAASEGRGEAPVLVVEAGESRDGASYLDGGAANADLSDLRADFPSDQVIVVLADAADGTVDSPFGPEQGPEPGAEPAPENGQEPGPEPGAEPGPEPGPDAATGPETQPSGYWVENDWYNGKDREYRLHFGSQHFATVLVTNEKTADLHAAVFRPHPGTDPNGWGSSFHLNPFVGGIDVASAYKQTITSAASAEGIAMTASGKVNWYSDFMGTWNASLLFTFDASAKKVVGTGTYSVSLVASLESVSGDLHLGKVVSNRLTQVPLQCGGTGLTGDASEVYAVRDGSSLSWDIAAYDQYCPSESAGDLAIDVRGKCNDVDTLAMGLTTGSSIASAHKPGLKVRFVTQDATAMIFCGRYSHLFEEPGCGGWTTGECPFADNLGMDQVIKYQGRAATSYAFTLEIVSAAASGDGDPTCCN